MSGSQETPAELIADFQTTYTYNLTFMGAVAWLGWEYLITLDREVRLVWRRKINSASVIFLLNRYIMLVQFAVQLPLSFLISDERYADFMRARFDRVAPYFVWAAFSSLRAYAMSNRTWPIAILVYLLSIATACYNIYNFIHLVPLNLPPPIYCIPTFPGLTVTFLDQQSAARANVKTSLLQLLLRDGTIYFVILLILNVLQIIVRITAQANFITTFEEPLTAILISRFLMNLREIDFTRSNSRVRGGATMSGIGAGGPLDDGVHSAMDFADRSHFTHTQTRTRGSEPQAFPADAEIDVGPEARRTALGAMDSFVSPLGAQLDHGLLFAAPAGQLEGVESTSGSTFNDGLSNVDADEPEVAEVDEIGMAVTLDDWADAERAL
ncbi:hypothetical protein ONZ51_g3950 [Trametes cubensis]|uniref:DUF6533 domain-containing protein n=1 Tax=Trametes cubensis TaxID=1111947 RepID=A0AAD7TX98_9APHY|nr:hypothetical protein ONZ51_g3950 [Trametes cubensis]